MFYEPKICPKCVSGRGSAPDSTGGAHDAPPDPLVGWGGDTPPQSPPYSAPQFSCLWRSPLSTFAARTPCILFSLPSAAPDVEYRSKDNCTFLTDTYLNCAVIESSGLWVRLSWVVNSSCRDVVPPVPCPLPPCYLPMSESWSRPCLAAAKLMWLICLLLLNAAKSVPVLPPTFSFSTFSLLPLQLPAYDGRTLHTAWFGSPPAGVMCRRQTV